jgi:hypothetical protein
MFALARLLPPEDQGVYRRRFSQPGAINSAVYCGEEHRGKDYRGEEHHFERALHLPTEGI